MVIMTEKKRLVSGIQPTGQMHLGNYIGAIKNWVTLQHDYDPYFLIVDLHSLTTSYDATSSLRQTKEDLAIDLIACGVDIDKCKLFYQSDVIEHSELHLILSMITPLPWLERVPTYKDKIKQLREKDLNTYGFLGYPVLQAADILLYKGDVVPVGKDQLPHLELTREISRRFNHFYKPIFNEPNELLTTTPMLSGIDGRKMSKSYGNIISLQDNADEVSKKVMKMYTDPNHIRVEDPGQVEGNVVFEYLSIFDPNQNEVDELKAHYKRGGLGDVKVKRRLIDVLNTYLDPIRKKRDDLLSSKSEIKQKLNDNAAKARDIALSTMKEVKEAIQL